MKTINRNQIENLFQPQVFQRGLDYYIKGRVIGLGYDRNREAWFAEVQGSLAYMVDIDLSMLEKGKIIPNCDCPAFETYHSCKHIVAVLLAISDQKQEMNLSDKTTSLFMDGLLTHLPNDIDVLSDRLPMHVDYILKLDFEGKVWLEWKAGLAHRYVVRNIREFLLHVTENEPHYFTNKFTFDPNQHYFLDRDERIFELMITFLDTGDLFTDNGYFKSTPYDKRSLLIPPSAIEQLLALLEDRQVVVETPHYEYGQLKVTKDLSPYHFTVTYGEDERLVLQMNGVKDTLFFEEYRFVFAEGTFYFPTKEQRNMITQIKRIGMSNHQLPIAGDNADRFFSEALPVLKRSAEVRISNDVEDEIVEFPLRAKLYLEQEKEMITGKLTYHYGNYQIDPFGTADIENDAIIIRDTETERQIMHLIEKSNFHYNGKELYIKMIEDEEVYDFLYSILPILNEYVELFLTSEIQHMIVETDPIPSTTVNVQHDTNLLEIGFDISGINDDEVNEIIQAVIEKKRFYKLDSGALISLEREGFHKMEELFDGLDVKGEDIKDGQITVPVYRGIYIDEMIDVKKYGDSFRKLLHTLKHPEEQIYAIPENLHADLRTYQEVGFQWFKSLSSYMLGGILADDMGLGKTLQTITYLLSEPNDKPHLIIVPSSVMYNWRNECRKFAPDLEVVIITGTPKEREILVKESHNKDIWITSYGTIRQDIDLYENISFQTMILDEAQFIKNYQTKTSKAVREIRASRRFALSGTPIENSVDELWAIFQVILPGLMPTQRDFRQMDTKKIAALTRPFILRRLKTDVLRELPEKIETVHTSELTKEQKDLYVGYLRELQEMTSASIAQNHFQQNRMKILAGLTRLRQLCCHPSLFIENYQGKSGKLDELMQQLQTMLASGKRLLIFSQFTSMHDIIMGELEQLGIQYFYLQGRTPAKERVEMSEAFNRGEKDVFLISLRAGGTGLNLTGADTVILFDLWWNPAVEDQAAGRAHRFGQKKVVQVIRFITEGTIEEKIYELQQKKRKLIDQVVQPGETLLTSLSEEDVKELLNM